MATIKTLEAELAELKKRVAVLEAEKKNTSSEEVEEKIIGVNAKDEPVAEKEKNSSPSPLAGILLIVIGGLLTLTLFGAIVGVPLLIWGIVKLNKLPKTTPLEKTEEESSEKKETTTKKKVVHIEAEKTVAKKTVSHQRKKGLEERMGMKWLGIIGISMLVLGVGYFVKYTVDNNWFGETTSIVLSVVLSLLMLGVGLIIKGDLKYWANLLTGGGFALLYYVIYSTYHFPVYHEAFNTNKYVVLLLLSLVVIGAVVVSLKKNERVIASVSLLLGYLTAFLSTQEQSLTLAYISILSIAYFYLSAKKNWLELDVGSLSLTYILYIIWLSAHPGEFLIPAIFLSAYALLFAIGYLRREYTHRSILFSILNSALYFIFFINLLLEHHPEALWIWAIITAVVYYTLLSYSQIKKAAVISSLYTYVLVGYMTLAIFDAFREQWVTIILAVVVYALYYVGKMYRGPATLLVGLVVVKTLIHNLFILPEMRMWTLLVVSALMFALRPLFHEDWEQKKLYPWFGTAFFALFVIELLPIEWETIALALVVFTFYLYGRYLRAPALALSFAVVAKTVIQHGFILEENRILIFLVTVALLYYLRTMAKEAWESKALFTWLAAGLLTLLILLEASSYWITIYWTLLAIIVLIFGFSLRQKDLRLQGILIILLAVGKALAYDTQALDEGWRTLSFIILGAILLLASYFYAKFKDRIL